MKRLSALALALLVSGLPLAHAEQPVDWQAGDWQMKFGLGIVDPTSGNGSLANGALSTDVGSGVSPTITVEYRVTQNFGIELLAALPFSHDVDLNGVEALSTKQLPPTLSAQWHFPTASRLDPFIGIGINFTRFFSIEEKGPLEGTSVDLGDSWGPALHVGVDYAFNDHWSMTGDIRWIGISSDVKVDGVDVGTVDIDPLVYGLAVGYRF
ncbi:OmpW family protein [Dokdonella sp.]|uniref:OmpW/AlkL family protein n=1 Tax=Dokdonella sp. TaxID=2291710 RepID=UPI0035299FD8